MKKFLLVFMATALLIAGNNVIAEPDAADDSGTPPKGQLSVSTGSLHTTTIDGIEVPFEVLTYAHTKYLGHAVTKASKVTSGGTSYYRLRVDRDIYADDYESIYLMYTMEWELVDEKDIPKPVEMPRHNSDSAKDKDADEKPEEKKEEVQEENASSTQQVEDEEKEEPEETGETDAGDVSDPPADEEETDEEVSPREPRRPRSPDL